ncbi:MAG: ABC transporter permease [Actinomycetota bacterium]|nr:ABC transporter permease [Actinomycetota bacterium]
MVSVAHRSLVSKLRNPTAVLPDFFAPLLLVAVFSASFGTSTDIPGFPHVRSFSDFALVGTIVIGVFFSASDVGEAVAIDIESGFFDRLILSPVPRSAILMGILASSAVFAIVECGFFIGVLTAFGVSIKGGSAAILTIGGVMTVLAIGTSALTTGVGLASGTSGSFGAYIPVSLAVIFVSSAYFPRELMHGWFRAVASVNPVSFLVEDLRHQVIVGFDLARAARAMAMVALLALGSGYAATRALRRRTSGR